MSPKCPVPTSSTLSCVVTGGRAGGVILAQCTSSKEPLPEFFKHALSVICAVNHTSPADTLWLPCSFPMSASGLSLHDEQDHLSMHPLVTPICHCQSAGSCCVVVLSNCSLKNRQFKRLPSNVGTSILGSCTPDIPITPLAVGGRGFSSLVPASRSIWTFTSLSSGSKVVPLSSRSSTFSINSRSPLIPQSSTSLFLTLSSYPCKVYTSTQGPSWSTSALIDL